MRPNSRASAHTRLSTIRTRRPPPPIRSPVVAAPPPLIGAGQIDEGPHVGQIPHEVQAVAHPEQLEPPAGEFLEHPAAGEVLDVPAEAPFQGVLPPLAGKPAPQGRGIPLARHMQVEDAAGAKDAEDLIQQALGVGHVLEHVDGEDPGELPVVGGDAIPGGEPGLDARVEPPKMLQGAAADVGAHPFQPRVDPSERPEEAAGPAPDLEHFAFCGEMGDRLRQPVPGDGAFAGPGALGPPHRLFVIEFGHGQLSSHPRFDRAGAGGRAVHGSAALIDFASALEDSRRFSPDNSRDSTTEGTKDVQDPGIPAESATLVAEAHALHHILFGGSAPESLVAAYVDAHRVWWPDAPVAGEGDVRRAVNLGLDLEALEMVFRLRGQNHPLVRKLGIFVALAEAFPRYQPRFVAHASRHWTAALGILAAHALRSAMKSVKGLYLIRRHGLG